MLSLLRRKLIIAPVSLFMTALLLADLLLINLPVYALTSGPSQPELEGFASVETGNRVDPFSGDFSYSIPLMDVDGFPLTISYQAGIGMEQEASWTGLGWNLAVGAINRNMRGIPDDFNGDQIVKKLNIKPNRSIGIGFTPNIELFGFGKNFPINLGLVYNNYQGLGFEVGTTISNISGKNSSLNLAYNSQKGFDASLANITFKDCKFIKDFDAGYNSRGGLQTVGLDMGRKKAKTTSFSNTSMPAHIPFTQSATNNYNLSFKFKSGGEITPAIFANATFTGYYSQQTLKRNSVAHPSYGCLYLQSRNGNDDLMDFNRSADIPFVPAMPHLSSSQLTFDQFSFSGMETGGSFRLHRLDVGQVSDPTVNSTTVGGTIGIEPGVGTGVHFGVNLGLTYSSSKSGKWVFNNTILDDYLQFTPSKPSDALYEPAYFKIDGEQASANEVFETDVSSFKPMRLPLKGFGFNVYADNRWELSGSHKDINSAISASERAKRRTSVSFFTAEIARFAALDKQIKTYPLNVFYNADGLLPYTPIDRTGQYRKPHHFSEFTIIDETGSRSVYGIPAYNTHTEEVSFNVKKNQQLSQKLVSYSDEDASAGNKNGKNHFYSKSIMPPYAHSFLLSAILSTDYLDISDDGPTTDDRGNYVKFNYTQLYSNFGWRSPTSAGQDYYAAYEPILKSIVDDDKGNYVYGTKEIWYLHSIETKNYIAIFKLTSRRDGIGVTGNSGLYDQLNPLMKLSSIELYTRNDLLQNKQNAIPVKTVNFEYDYSLCPQVSNNTAIAEIINGININAAKGKLTLKKISFQNGISKRGLMSPYSFDYSDSNPSYNRLSMDRWGNYKPESTLDNMEYPYTEQNKNMEDVYASAWNLTGINLPSGGRISVEYESDDYAYVQNVPAAKMFIISGVGRSEDFGAGTTLTSGSLDPLHVYVKLDWPLNNDGEFQNLYLKNLKYLYFKNYIDITGKGDYEYIKGYAEIIDAGLCPNDPGYGWISLKDMPSGDLQSLNIPFINPFSKYALSFARSNMMDKIFPLSNMNFDGSKIKLGRALLGVAVDFASLATGMNASLLGNGFCKKIDHSKSWVRLYEPSGKKLGGGHRVKFIKTYDHWKDMSGSSNESYYGKAYSYLTTDKKGAEISSGVASYEPAIGGDENSMHTPVFYEIKTSLFSKDLAYLETPLEESSYPSPSVGYSRVVEKNIERTKVSAHGTGFTVYEFFTSSTDPSVADNTILDKKKLDPVSNYVLNLISPIKFESMFLSQGFSVIHNNMHGKPKSVYHYPEFDDHAPVAGVDYLYYPSNGKLCFIDTNGAVIKSEAGKDIDITLETQSEKTLTGAIDADLNIDQFFLGVIPALSITAIPKFMLSVSNYASSSVTKIIHKTGVLKAVRKWDMGSIVINENTAFNKETGQPLSTKTYNEYNDAEYSSALPAYWAYPQMGPAYRNLKAEGNILIQQGSSPVWNNHPFKKGDELLTRPFLPSTPNTYDKLWVTDISNGLVFFHHKDGTVPDSGNYYYMIIRSGNRNRLTQQSAKTYSLQNPVTTNNLMTNDSIIEAAATKYTDDLRFPCRFQEYDTCTTDNCLIKSACANPAIYTNPYAYGARGNWQAYQSYVFRSGRSYQTPLNQNSSNARYDGLYLNYSPYWNYNGQQWASVNNTDWVKADETTFFTLNGDEAEAKNPINIYSSSLLGYNQTLAVAKADNVRYQEVFFDNMEEYVYLYPEQKCTPVFRSYLQDFLIDTCMNALSPNLVSVGDLYGLVVYTVTSSVVDSTAAICINNHLTSTTSHTGLFSFIVTTDSTPQFRFPVSAVNPCLDNFAMAPGTPYILSLWIKEPIALNDVLTYHTTANISFDSSITTPIEIAPAGIIIEGWQKIEGVFVIPPNATYVEIGFNNHNNTILCLDDIRIFPAAAKMLSYVYNPYNLQLMAQLDENNYAAFYEYGEEQEFRRIKKETEFGVQTFREIGVNLHKPKPTPFIGPVKLNLGKSKKY